MVEWLRWILSSTIVWNMESHLKCLSSFVQFIGMNEPLLHEVFLDTLDMLKKEHAIFELWSAINPLLPQGGRRLLSIY